MMQERRIGRVDRRLAATVVPRALPWAGMRCPVGARPRWGTSATRDGGPRALVWNNARKYADINA
jgi:hypothetical protein